MHYCDVVEREGKPSTCCEEREDVVSEFLELRWPEI